LTWFSGFSTFGQVTLDLGVFIRSMGSPNCEDMKFAMYEVYFIGTCFTPFFGGFGAWIISKEAEMAKTLRSGFSMS
jgi:hypothetical protein